MISTTLSAREQLVLDGIRSFVAEHGYPPTVRELGRRVGISSSQTIFQHLLTLEAKGWIQRDPKVARAIRVMDPQGAAT